jgi:pyruvate-formate lyase-activating enzyme
MYLPLSPLETTTGTYGVVYTKVNVTDKLLEVLRARGFQASVVTNPFTKEAALDSLQILAGN